MTPPQEGGDRTPSRRPVSPGRRRTFRLALLLLIPFAVECLSWITGRFLMAERTFYLPPAPGNLHQYKLLRDPDLGWPSPTRRGKSDTDAAGSRPVPAFPEPGGECVSLYGDSFTYGQEVGHEEAWGNVLARELGCRVANYGVMGYGSDQAMIRFLLNDSDPARHVVLGHLSENVLRNSNQWRHLIYGGGEFGFKPRFILDDAGKLVRLPMPEIPEERYEDFLRNPEDYLEHDWFVPDGPGGLTRLEFPYTMSVIRSFGNFRNTARRRGMASYEPFYLPDHPSDMLAVTTAILAEFDRVARERGQTPVIALFPTGYDLRKRHGGGEWTYQPLIDALLARGLNPLNLGDGMLERLAGRDPCELFTRCDAHYNAEGYSIVADLVRERIIPEPAADAQP